MPKRKKRKARPFPYGDVAFDYETDGLKPYDGSRAFIAGVEDEAGNVIKARPGDPDWHRVKGVIEDPDIDKICHGASFELKHSHHLGLDPAGKFHDTMAQAVLENEYQPINLDALSQLHLRDFSKGIVQDWLKKNARRIRKETGRDPNYADVPKELLEKYLEGDLDKTLRLHWMMYPDVRKRFGKLYDMETDLAWDIAKMEDTGIRVDLPYIHKNINALKPRMDRIHKELENIAEMRFNPGSRFDLSYVMEGLDLDTGERNKDSSMKTSFELLETMDSTPFIDKLVEWRGLKKILNTYLVPFTQKAYGDVIHGSFWQYGRDKAIVTGRFSATDPNLQNIPGGGRSTNKILIELGPIVRRAIIPPEDHVMLFFDYKQIEMLIFSCYAGNPDTIDAIRKGADVYVAQAMNMFGKQVFAGLSQAEFKRKRFQAKELCLAQIYGMGLKRFARRVKVTLAEARSMRNAFFSASPETRDFMMHSTRDLLVQGYVEDVFGRNYHVPRALAYKSVNALCQGSAATVMKKGIIRARPLSSLGAKPVMTIHDELAMFARRDNWQEVAREGKKLLEDLTSFELPIKVDVAVSFDNWADKRKVKFDKRGKISVGDLD